MAAYNSALEEYRNAEVGREVLPERRFHIRLPGVLSKRSMRRRTESGRARVMFR